MRASDGSFGAPHAVTIDALGTLIRLEPPAPVLACALADAGFPQPEGAVVDAVTDEVAFYRENLHRGQDQASLAELRRDCARVLAAGLPDPVPPAEALVRILIDSLRFRPHLDAIPALDALRMAGVPVVVLSNWDCSLPDVLAPLGMLQRVDTVLPSAVIGAQKPAPEAFAAAARWLGAPASDIVHCGDDPHRDAVGARAAGMRAVLIDREGAARPGPWRTISDLRQLPALLGLSGAYRPMLP